MEKYEYKTDKIRTDKFERGSQDELDYLNSKGEFEWELVSVINVGMGGATLYYWRRIKNK